MSEATLDKMRWIFRILEGIGGLGIFYFARESLLSAPGMFLVAVVSILLYLATMWFGTLVTSTLSVFSLKADIVVTVLALIIPLPLAIWATLQTGWPITLFLFSFILEHVASFLQEPSL